MAEWVNERRMNVVYTHVVLCGHSKQVCCGWPFINVCTGYVHAHCSFYIYKLQVPDGTKYQQSTVQPSRAVCYRGMCEYQSSLLRFLPCSFSL